MSRAFLVIIPLLLITLFSELKGQDLDKRIPSGARITLRKNTFSKSFSDRMDSLMRKELGRGVVDIEGVKLTDLWNEFLSNGGRAESGTLQLGDCWLCQDDELQIELDSFIEQWLEPDGSLYDQKVSFTFKIFVRYMGKGLFEKDKDFTLTEKGNIGYFDWQIERDTILVTKSLLLKLN